MKKIFVLALSLASVATAFAGGLTTTNNYSRTSHAFGVGLDWNFGVRK